MRKLSDFVRDIVPLDEKDAGQSPERGYLARELVQCTLPHRDPGELPYYIRTDGNFTLSVQPGINPHTKKPYGLPYGSIPRLLLLWLTSEAVRTQSRRIELGNSLGEFLEEVGLSRDTGRGKRGDAKRLKEQLLRLFSARFSFHYSEGNEMKGGHATIEMPLAGQREFWWDFQNPNQAAFFDSYVVLGEEFYKALTSNPVPFDVNAVKSLKRSPLAIDLYCWLCWRVHRMTPGASVTIGYRSLQDQFGGEYSRARDFKTALSEALEKVEQVLPAVKYELGSRGLVLTGILKKDLPIQPKKADPALPFGREPKSPFDLPVPDMLRAGAYSKGWDERVLRTSWEAWCKEKGIVPKQPLAHFIRFIQSHIRKNGSGH